MYRHTEDDGFPHRASFELTDEDLEAARAGVVPDLSHYPQPPPSAAQRQAAQAWTEWKVCTEAGEMASWHTVTSPTGQVP